MTEQFEDFFHKAISQALNWKEGQPPSAIYEALALVCVSEALAKLSEVRKADRDALARLGRRALLQAGGRTDEEAEALALVLPLARRGLAFLAGTAPANGRDGAAIYLTHPGPSELVAMTRGKPDAFGAASVALHVLQCAPCAADLSLLERVREPAGISLRAAAADLSPMLSPTEGHSVGTCEALSAEAVLFDGGVLAVYANEPLAVRLVVEGGTTDDMRPGYWSGRVPQDTATLDATLYVGDKTTTWKIRLH
jgi:hypothetical protein